MKPICILYCAILIINIQACKKGSAPLVNHNLTGKWLYKENGYSIGGPMIWTAPTPAGQTIEFKNDGTFISAVNFLNGCNRYEKLDSVTLKFTPAPYISGYIKMGFKIDSTTGKLHFWPVEPVCIEGCGYVFVRRNS